MSNLYFDKVSKFQGIYEIARSSFEDHRGEFCRIFCEQQFEKISDLKISQVNFSRTSEKGTIRGIHLQRPPKAEVKYVSCLRGTIFDILVDLRLGSESYGKHYKTILSREKQNGILIPQGFGHGFQALSHEVELIYFHSEPYDPELEDGINALDPDLDIQWPLKLTNISAKDAALASIGEFKGISI